MATMEHIGKIETIQDKINTLKLWPGRPDSADKAFLRGVAKDLERLLEEREEMIRKSRFCPNCGAKMDDKGKCAGDSLRCVLSDAEQSEVQEMLAKILKIDECALNIQMISGFTLEQIFEMLKGGYTLEPPTKTDGCYK